MNLLISKCHECFLCFMIDTLYYIGMTDTSYRNILVSIQEIYLQVQQDLWIQYFMSNFSKHVDYLKTICESSVRPWTLSSVIPQMFNLI